MKMMVISFRFFSFLLALTCCFVQPLQGQEKTFATKDDASAFGFSPRLGIHFGSTFSVGGYAGGLFSHALAPNLSLPVSEKLQIEVGSVFSYTKMNSFSQTAALLGGQMAYAYPGGNMQSATFYTVGSYQVNPRFRITGGAWTERVTGDSSLYQMNPQAMEMNPKGVLMGFDYKITDNLRFGAEINMSTAPMGYYAPGHPASFFNHRPGPYRQGGW